MSPMDILTSLVKRSAGGNGGSLPDVLGGGRRSPEPKPHARATRPQSADQMARSLEDLLGVGESSPPKRSPAPSPPTSSRPTSNRQTSNQPDIAISSPQIRRPSSADNPFAQPSQPVDTDTKESLIRIMLAAAKADGHLDESEQKEIFEQLGKVSDSELEFLRREFESNIDVRELAWAVPIGLEQAAYQAAILSMKLDEQSEVQFLASLQHGLRLSPKWCNQIHQQYGKPTIFRI